MSKSQMSGRWLVTIIFMATVLFNFTMARVDFDQCLMEIHAGRWGPSGAVDNEGQPVSNISTATAITYKLCTEACGSGSEPFSWSVFSQRFGSWLLPWLALISQLPFGEDDRYDNFVSMVLTVGSPNLAAYSLVLTVLNGRWVSRLFAPYTYPNTRNAVYILDSLQQAPLVVQSEGGLLASLVVLPENDEWWNETVVWLDYTHTWTISSISSIAWVIIAYVFTIIDAFSGNLLSAIRAHGEGVGSVWLWLLPIVIGWLQISPKCESKRLAQALKRANEHAYVATIDHGPALASTVSGTRAIGLQRASGALAHGDEKCFCPVNNYARVFSWAQNVETISEVFRAASARTNQHHPVNSQIDWVTCSKEKIHPSNRRGDMEQVISYCNPKLESRSRWGRGVWSRCLTASVVAFFLQWGTTGAAVIVSWLTPTRGLGCRSGAYLIYGIGSTLVWAMLLLSSIFAHYSTLEPPEYLGHRKRVSAQVARRISSMLRRTGKFIAACNAIWIVLSCLFQFSNVFDRCFCNSSVFGLKGKAFDILIFLGDDVASMRTAWIGGVILAAGTAVGFVVFVGLFINPPFPAPNE